MKYCPNCQTTYTDNSLQFCLEDGTRLLGYSSESSQMPTQVFGETETIIRQNQMPADREQSQVTRVATLQPRAKKSNAPLIIILIALTICVFLGSVAGVWLLLSAGTSGVEDSSNIYNPNKTYNSSTPSLTSMMTPNANTSERKQIDKINSGVNIGKGGQFIGCFKDTSAFDLDGYLERSRTNTPQSCIETCRKRGFKYAGVQYSESCLCGNSYGKYGAADNCNMKCTGDGNQICGGYSVNSVYTTEILKACDYFLGSGLYDKWKQMGGENGNLGCPTMNEIEAESSPQGTTGRMTQFSKGDGGYIVWHGSGRFSGASFEVSGCMFKIYASIGGTKSWLGFPIKDGSNTSTGARQDFEGGYILWDSKTYNCQSYKNY